MFYFDPIYWLFIGPGILLGLYAQIKLSSTYNKYVRVPVASGITGAEAAREILDRAGLQSMAVREVPGHLSDHYDPMKRALFLSGENYHGRSLAAVGVAAHEAGHALQHKTAYPPLQLRMMLVPATQFASHAWIVLVLIGMFFTGPWASKFLNVGIGVFAVLTLFQIVTLPVEFNASSRAKQQLLKLGLVQPTEASGVAKVLNAAALTYVAAMVASVMQLLHLLSLARRQD